MDEMVQYTQTFDYSTSPSVGISKTELNHGRHR
jgi:hypothetical protein